jgi:hypothetical protein
MTTMFRTTTGRTQTMSRTARFGLAVAGVTVVLAGTPCALAAQQAPITPTKQLRTTRPPQAPAKVTGFVPSASPKTFNGGCPATITFTSVINANQYPVMAQYQWERSDGATGQKQSVQLTAKGQTVSDTWQLGGKGERLSVWEKVHVLSPNDLSSGHAAARITCAK